MEHVLQLLVVLPAALATEGLMVNWIGLGRAMSRLSVSPCVEFHQATNHTFDPYLPIVVVGALLGGSVLAILSPGIRSLSGELALPDLSVMPPSWRLACPQTSESTNRSLAGPFIGRPMTGRLFAPTGFDFTFCVLLLHFQDWPATFLLVL